MSPTHRPARLVAVVGTGTEIGKTWATARIAEHLRATGRTVAARKPIQSFAPDDIGRTDAEVLAAATGEEPAAVCPSHRWLAEPMAPPMAADALGTTCPTLDELVAELRWPATATDVGFVETVGGVRSPLAADGDSRDLVRAVGPDRVLLVADAGLGTIDAVRLATDALAPLDVVVLLNRFDPDHDLHRRNAAWLTDVDHRTVVLDPGTAARALEA